MRNRLVQVRVRRFGDGCQLSGDFYGDIFVLLVIADAIAFFALDLLRMGFRFDQAKVGLDIFGPGGTTRNLRVEITNYSFYISLFDEFCINLLRAPLLVVMWGKRCFQLPFYCMVSSTALVVLKMLHMHQIVAWAGNAPHYSSAPTPAPTPAETLSGFAGVT
jgi:hypothetical protein